MCDCKGKCATVRCLCRKGHHFCNNNCSCRGRCQNSSSRPVSSVQGNPMRNIHTERQARDADLRAMQLALQHLQQFPPNTPISKIIPSANGNIKGSNVAQAVQAAVQAVNPMSASSISGFPENQYDYVQQTAQAMLACSVCCTPLSNNTSVTLSCGHNIHVACVPTSNDGSREAECPVCTALFSVANNNSTTTEKKTDPAFDAPSFRPINTLFAQRPTVVDNAANHLVLLTQKDLCMWTEAELMMWMQHFRNGHYRPIQPVFRHVSGFDVANIVDDDFRAHINHLFKDEPSRALVAISCWRQLRTYMRVPPPCPVPKPSRRRKRAPLSFGSMLQILNQWQINIDTGLSESSASRMLQDERVCRTTLRSWRHISKLAVDHGIDLASGQHSPRGVSLSYVHKLIAQQVATKKKQEENPPPAFSPSASSQQSQQSAVSQSVKVQPKITHPQMQI